MQFAHPYVLGLLVLVPVLGWWLWARAYRQPRIGLSTDPQLTHPSTSRWAMLRWVAPGLGLLALALGILALARPQQYEVVAENSATGLNLVLCVDVSESMETADLPPSRLVAAQQVTRKFVGGLRNDRVGLVVFAEAALIACPLTLDYPFVQNALKGLNTSLMPKQGTAVGEAIGLSLLMLDTLANSGNSAIVLVTDGASNRGVIGPLTAADLARQRNVRVYAIGVGDSTIQLNTGIGTTNRATEQDLAYLQTLANHTGGRFWRATQPNALAEVFREIEQLERATVGSRFERLTVENYRPYALAAFICACAAFLALGVGMANPLEH